MSRVVLIDSRATGDWSLDLLFSGLIRNLGHDGVIDFPSHQKHRMGKPVLVGDHERDWGAERMSLSYAPEWDQLKTWTQQEVIEEIREGRVSRIFLDERDESYEIYLKLKASFFDVPVTVVAGHDRFWNHSPEWVWRHRFPRYSTRMWLSNWRPEYDQLPYARPYNWSVNFDHLWDRFQRKQLLSEKVYDISFMGYNSHPDREMYIDHILSKWGHLRNHVVFERRPNSFDMFVPKDEYFRTIAQSRVCLNLRGAAEDGKTMRFFEIPYVGSCMLSQRTTEKFDHPFLGQQHCSFFSNIQELDLRLDRLLSAPDHREDMAAAGHRHVFEKHLAGYRVREMLSL